MSVLYISHRTPLVYSKTGVCRGLPIFLIFALKHRLVYVLFQLHRFSFLYAGLLVFKRSYASFINPLHPVTIPRSFACLKPFCKALCVYLILLSTSTALSFLSFSIEIVFRSRSSGIFITLPCHHRCASCTNVCILCLSDVFRNLVLPFDFNSFCLAAYLEMFVSLFA